MRSSPSAGCMCFQLVSLSALFLPRAALSPTLMTDGGSCAAVNSPLPPAVPRLLWSKSKNLQYHRVIRRLLKPPANPAFFLQKKKYNLQHERCNRESRVQSSRAFTEENSALWILNNTVGLYFCFKVQTYLTPSAQNKQKLDTSSRLLSAGCRKGVEKAEIEEVVIG